jgi:hypothetical protein
MMGVISKGRIVRLGSVVGRLHKRLSYVPDSERDTYSGRFNLLTGTKVYRKEGARVGGINNPQTVVLYRGNNGNLGICSADTFDAFFCKSFEVSRGTLEEIYKRLGGEAVFNTLPYQDHRETN